jgi:hypothetical protein
MKSFALLSLLVPALFSSGNAWSNIRAEESTKEIQDGQTGTLMVLPPLQTDTGTKRIPGMYILASRLSHQRLITMSTPDADHPFIAPGPNDQRGRTLLMQVLKPILLTGFFSMPFVLVLEMWLVCA